MSYEKSIIIDKAPNSPHWVIKWVGGGEVPDVLKGTYTNYSSAEEALAVWQHQKAAEIANRTKKRAT